jgi:hypothetical protein
MAVRTAAAAAIDTTVSTLKTQLVAYIGLQQPTAGDAPAVLFYQWLIGQLINADPAMAQAVRTANAHDPRTWDKTLSSIDGYA